MMELRIGRVWLWLAHPRAWEVLLRVAVILAGLVVVVAACTPAHAQPMTAEDAAALSMWQNPTPPTQQSEPWAVALFSWFTSMTDRVNAKLDNAIGQMIAAEVTWVRGWLLDALMLVVIVEIMGAMIPSAMGGGAIGFDIVLRRCLRYGVIVALFMTVPAYQANVTATFQSIVADVSNILTSAMGGGGFGGGKTFDHAFNSVWQAWAVAQKHMPRTEGFMAAMGFYIVGGICLLVGAGCVALAFIAWLAAGVTFKLGIAVGPLFIAAALSKATVSFTNNWIAVTATAGFLQILAVASIALMGFVESDTTDMVTAGTGPGTNTATELQSLLIMAATTGILAVFIWTQGSHMASRLFHGVHVGVGSYTRAFADTMSSAGSFASGLVTGGRAAGALAQRAGNYLTGGPSGGGGGSGVGSRAYSTATQAAGRARGYVP